MNNYDVAVIGCGPAGLRTSLKLAEKGASVIALDKKQEIGVPVRCAEGIGAAWLQRLCIKPRDEWIGQDIYGAVLYMPSGKKLELRTKGVAGHVIERRMFEKFLAREAVRKGAHIRVKTHAKGFERKVGYVEVTAKEYEKEEKYSAKIIIASDGIDSLTARRFGSDTKHSLDDVEAGYQYEMAGIDIESPELIHLYFGNKIAPLGYAWIFPKGKNEANVGIGIRGTDPNTARYYLDRFIKNQEKLRNGSIIHINAGVVPVGGFLNNMVKDNLIAVGDAAHQVDPIHGGGMGIAIEAADLAAEVALEALSKGDYSETFLGRYNKLWYDKRGNSLKKRLKLRRMVENFTDEEFESLASSISTDNILMIGENEFAPKAKIILKLITKPSLGKKVLKHFS